MNNFKPVNGWLIIEPLSNEEKAGSLYLPENIKAAYKLAKVLAVSVLSEKTSINVGDIVLYDSLGATPVRINDKTVTILKSVEVVTVVE